MTVGSRKVDVGAGQRAFHLTPHLLESVVADLPPGWTGPIVLDRGPSGLVAYPAVPATRVDGWGRTPRAPRDDGERFIVESCPFCGCDHVHGAAEGHRVAHCPTEKKPASGYWLYERIATGLEL